MAAHQLPGINEDLQPPGLNLRGMGGARELEKKKWWI